MLPSSYIPFVRKKVPVSNPILRLFFAACARNFFGEKNRVFEIVQCTHQDIWLDFFILYVFIYLSTYILNTMMKKKLFSRRRFQCQDDDDDDGEVCFSE